MSILSDNKEYLKKTNASLYSIIESRLDSSRDDDPNITIHESKTGDPNIKVVCDGIEHYIHSKYNPVIESKRWAQSVSSDAGLVIILGLGLGYHIQSIRETLDKNTQVCVIEPNIHIFRHFIESRVLADIFDERMTLILSDEAEEIAKDIFVLFKSALLDKVEIKVYSGYSRLYKELFEHIQTAVSMNIKNLSVNIATTEYFKNIWLMNFIYNISNINQASNGASLVDSFKDIPAVIVSAGPSLNKNVEYLKSIKNKALILAGGSAIGILKKHDITPHFMVAIDGSLAEKEIFKGIDFEGIPLIYINRLYHEIVSEYKYKKFVFIDSEDKLTNYFNSKFNVNLSEVAADQTVAGINIIIATLLGCNPVVFVGQDLAYTNMEMHAEGAAHMRNFEEDIGKIPDKFIKTKDIYGNETYTIKQFLTARAGMERKMEGAVKEGYRFINASEGGIGMKHCENMDLTEAASLHFKKTYDLNSIIEGCYRKGLFNLQKEELKRFFDEVLSEADSMKKTAIDLHELCLEAKKIHEKKNINQVKYQKTAIKINNLQNKIEYDSFFKEFIVAAIEQTLAVHRIIMDNKLKTARNSMEKNVIRIESINRQCVEIIGACNTVVKLINSLKYDSRG